MGRDPRFIPPNSLQHVVDTTFQSRFLLRPSESVNRLFLGVLGRAQRQEAMKICAVVVMSNHYHLLLRPKDGEQLAKFMCFLKTNLAKELGTRLRRWQGRFFHGRYHSTTVSDEDAAQIRVLRYILAHGAKERLVDRVYQWPGVHSARSLVEGRPMAGLWFDRSSESNGHQSCDSEKQQSSGELEEVRLSPLPCWQHLSTSAWRALVREMVGEIDRTAAADRAADGMTSLGAEKVLGLDPLHRPDEVEKSPQPRFHAVKRSMLMKMVEIWRNVMTAYHQASEALRNGDRRAVFPEGTFPSALPFVPFSEATLAGSAVDARGQPV